MEQVTNAILNAARFHHKLTGAPMSEDFTRQVKFLGAGIFRLVVMGEIKKGKSSFINALIGVKDLVPVSSDVATSTVFKIHYGSVPGYCVHFEKETGKEPLKIEAAELASYGTENGNPGNAKQVDFIEVIHPAPLLKEGMVIIDTPGLGGLFKEHKKITWSYVPKADAVFFVTDSVESPIGLEEIEHLKTVVKITQHLYFVQTKASAVDKEAREARRQNNLNILSQAFNTPGNQIPYFVVDSVRKFEADNTINLKKLERSGYPELMAYLNARLLPNKHRILASKAISMALPLLKGIEENIAMRRETLEADTEEKQKKTKAELAAAETKLQQWQTERLPELRTRISRDFTVLRSECENDSAKLRPNGELHALLEDAIQNAENQKSLKAIVEQIQTQLPESAAALLNDMNQKLVKGGRRIILTLSQETGAPAVEDNTSSQQTGSTIAFTANNYLSTALGEINKGSKSWSYISQGLTGVGVGFTLGSFIPIPGAQLVTLAYGGYQAVKILREQTLKQGKVNAINALGKSLTSVYSDINLKLRERINQFNFDIDSTLNSTLKLHSEALKNAHANLVERARMTASELSAAKNQLAQDEAQLRSIMKAIEPWTPTQTK